MESEVRNIENLESCRKIKSKVQILDAAFHPTESIIALGTINGKLKLYKVSDEKKRLISVHKLHKKSLRKIAFPVNDSNLVFTASKDKSIKLTDLKHEESVLHIEKAHDKPINCLVTIDNWLIASADDDGVVKIWDYRQKKAVMESKDCQDYISDLAVGNDKRILLATSGEGTLSAFHTKKKKMVLQSELIDSEMLCIAFLKNDEKVVCGTGEGVLNIFNKDEWGNMSDRFTGHPSSVDSIVKISEDIFLTGCFDGNIRACSIQPNRFIGVIGDHSGFPVQHLCVSSDNSTCASISHDECVKFWNVEKISEMKVKEKKVKSKVMVNKNVAAKGKFDGFFNDLVGDAGKKKKKKNDDDSDTDSDSDEFSSDDESNKSDASDASSDESDDAD